MTKRTDLDFSAHALTIIKDEHTLIHKLKIPDRYTHMIQFINVCGNLVVNGDYGNWIFCREFHPSPEGSVCDSYWIEKLGIASCQVPATFSSEATKRELNECIAAAQEDGQDDLVEYYTECLDYVDDDEWSYVYHAYDLLPKDRDSECMVVQKEVSYSLLVIFDAFDEICNRLRLGEAKMEQQK